MNAPMSALSNKISCQLVEDILDGTISSGDHIGTKSVAERFGVSRTPVREALNLLEAEGILQRQVNKGFFVSSSATAAGSDWLGKQKQTTGDDYQKMADDWLTDGLPEEVTEQYLRQKYGWTKTKVGDLLMRAAREGWAERKEGYGWRFLPVAKTAAAFDGIYRFRMAIEPAAMLEPTWELDREALDEQKRIQSGMLENGMNGTPDERLLNNGAEFHEVLIRMSGNPYFLTALQRVNRMRRLLEYRTKVDFERLSVQCSEHLEIVRLIEVGELVEASYFMRRHLSGALERKSPLDRNWSAFAQVSDGSE